jgi:RNA polymerase sigma-70 factor (ECF subfamily)
LEDRILIWKLRRDSRAALSRIYEKYRDFLLRIACGLVRQSVAEDIVHDVFISFVRNRESFELKSSLKNYLATGVVNRARSYYRKKERNTTIDNEQIKLTVSEYKGPEQWIIHNEQTKLLNEALEKLSFEQKEAVVLHTQGQLKFRQIAQIQDVSIKTAQSRYRYGVEKLRSLLDGKVTL